MRTALRASLVVIATTVVTLCCASAAFGWPGYGKNPPAKLPLYPTKTCSCHPGDPGSFQDTSPHRGFSTTSSKCEVCHTVHGAGGKLVLLFADTVVDTCEECHDGTGGNDVYMLTSRGLKPASGHRALTPTASVVPGGDAVTGGSVTRTFGAPGGYLVCTDCHSVHDANAVANFRWNGNAEDTDMLLKQHPTSAVATVTDYGSDWCASCHAGRLSGGAVHNHPVDSLKTRSDPFTLANVVVTRSTLPVGIVVASDDTVYVADKGNLRIQRFTSAGGFLGSWADAGSTGLTIDSSGTLDAVASQYATQTNVIAQYSLSGVYKGTINKMQSWGVSIASAASAGNNKVYYSGPNSGSLGRMTNDALVAGSPYSFPATSSPMVVAVATDGRVWAADVRNNVIRTVNVSGETYTTGPVYGGPGSGPVQFSVPLGLAPATSGGMYVADSGNDRIQQLDASGNLVRQWGSRGSGDGQFDKPEGIAVGPDGSVYVADAGNRRIQKFTSAGAFVTKWGSAGSASGQFDFTDAGGLTSYEGYAWWSFGSKLMPMPRLPLQQGHAPICQQCHADASDPGQVTSNGITFVNGLDSNYNYFPTYSAYNNPQYNMAFPHESPNPSLLIGDGDRLCLDCHPAGSLP